MMLGAKNTVLFTSDHLCQRRTQILSVFSEVIVLDLSHSEAMSLIMLMSVVAFLGAMYLENGLTSATVLFTNLAFEEQVSFVLFVSLNVRS